VWIDTACIWDGDEEWYALLADQALEVPGQDLASPVVEEEKVVSAELDLDQIALERRMFDPVGHHNRPDVFRLAVDTMARRPVVEVPLSAEKVP
jgi:nitrilase